MDALLNEVMTYAGEILTFLATAVAGGIVYLVKKTRTPLDEQFAEKLAEKLSDKLK